MAATTQLRRIKNWSAEYRSNDIVCFQTFFELKTTSILFGEFTLSKMKLHQLLLALLLHTTKTYMYFLSRIFVDIGGSNHYKDVN